MVRRNNILDGLFTAVGTLTVIPVGERPPAFKTSLPWFPVVGFVTGAVVFAPALLLRMPGALEALLVGFVGVVLDVLLTGGMHLDGLGDTADAFFSMTGRERRLEIMKDPRLGSYGVIAVVLFVLGKMIALGVLASRGCWGEVVAAYALSRASQVQLLGFNDSARGGEGTGGPFIDSAGPGDALVAYAVCALILSPFFSAVLVLIFASCPLLTWLFGRVVSGRFGGVTGDVVGGGGEFALLSMLVVAVFAG